MKLILIGPQGSGKGVQARMLKEKYNIITLSPGQLFREEKAKGTTLGKELDAIMQTGALVPDEITVRILKKRLQQDDCKKGYILDGFPRTIEQAKMLNAQVDHVLLIDISDEESIKRISKRVQCKKCGAIYPGLDKTTCEACGGETYQREDDKAAILKTRLELYHNAINPILDYYTEKGLLRRIDGEQREEEVFAEIVGEIGKE